MDTAVGRDRFWEMFKGRAVVVSELPAGPSRVLANVASEMAGRDDASLRTKAEYEALFDLLLAHVPPAPGGPPPPPGRSRTTSARRWGSRSSSTRTCTCFTSPGTGPGAMC
jgi:hypothetical protein